MDTVTLIKTLMNEQNINLTTLSNMSGVATSTVSDLLNRKHRPTMRTIRNILKALL